ncbi:MAG: DNA polymerase Y family protein [Ahrensia sp.]|nr:DNA polymerase Y family protein [Ahrensia sp.]
MNASAQAQPQPQLKPRILSLSFPHLATDRTQRARLGSRWRLHAKTDDLWPMVHAQRTNNMMRIAHMDERARDLGLRIDQGLTDAKALFPDLDIVPSDDRADRRVLEGIADWCDRYTPLVALDAPDGLFLDITGCAHLFGGEHALLRDILSALFHQGFAVRGAIASTAGCAWAGARFSGQQAIHIEKDSEADILRPFGLAALRLNPDLVHGLEKVGLKTIGQLMDVPRAPLTRRFGRAALMRLDQALGQIDEVLSPRLPVPELSVERRLAEPVGRVEDIEQLLYQLARSLKPSLEEKTVGARVLELTLFRVDGQVSRLCVGASHPVRDPETIVKLFSERLKGIGDDFDAGYGFDIVRLNVVCHGPMVATQIDMAASDDVASGCDVALLMDRIAARLGSTIDVHQGGHIAHPVGRIMTKQSHVPEKAEHLVASDSNSNSNSNRQSDETAGLSKRLMAQRPIRLFAPAEPIDVIAQVPEGPPVQFKWRRALYRIAKSEGPERIARRMVG